MAGINITPDDLKQLPDWSRNADILDRIAASLLSTETPDELFDAVEAQGECLSGVERKALIWAQRALRTDAAGLQSVLDDAPLVGKAHDLSAREMALIAFMEDCIEVSAKL